MGADLVKVQQGIEAAEAMRLEAGMAFSELKGVLPSAAQQGVIFNGVNYTVGDIIENNKGQKGRVEADGTITILE